MNIIIKIAYDGTGFNGWQTQPDGNTIQDAVEKALSQAYQRTIRVQGASRTDAGVHALGQIASFTTTSNDIGLPVERLPQILNRILPSQIVVTGSKVVDNDFHPISSAKDKTYCYKIYNGNYSNPLIQNHVYFFPKQLDLESMRQGAKFFVGRHDFIGFCSSGSSAKTTVREIMMLDIDQGNELITVFIKGNGFLYNMVRIIVGTLIDVGTGKKQPEDIPSIIQSKQRKNAGETAPAKGLTLLDINYGNERTYKREKVLESE